jgi:uncharacterized short protein YbdD (DUF466 family)
MEVRFPQNRGQTSVRPAPTMTNLKLEFQLCRKILAANDVLLTRMQEMIRYCELNYSNASRDYVVLNELLSQFLNQRNPLHSLTAFPSLGEEIQAVENKEIAINNELGFKKNSWERVVVLQNRKHELQGTKTAYSEKLEALKPQLKLEFANLQVYEKYVKKMRWSDPNELISLKNDEYFRNYFTTL